MGTRPKRAAKRILLVDDEPDTVAGIRQRLLARGFDVLSAQSGEEALAVARRERPDVILLDLLLPKGDGSTVAHTLERDPRTRRIPIVFLTCLAEALDVNRTAHTADGRWLLPKALDSRKLLVVIEQVMRWNASGGGGGSHRAASPG